jgi:MFS family permease
MRIRLLTPLEDGRFRLLWSGQAISYLGNGVMTVALAWQALALSPKATSLSVVLLARSVSMLALLLVGGAISDRVQRRTIMLVSDAVRGVLLVALAVLAGTDAIQLWHLVAVAAVFGGAEAFFFPAFTAIVPDLLSGDRLVQANALEAAIRPLMYRMLGPALGGAIVATAGTDIAFAIDAVTFFVSTGCLLAMRFPPRTAATPESRTLRSDIVEGLRYTRSTPWIWATLLMAAFAVLSFIGAQDVVLPIYVREHLHAGARGFGLLVAAVGGGGIVGALVASQVGVGRRRVRNMYLVWGVAVIPFAMLGLTTRLPVAMVLMALLGAGFEIGSIMWVTLLQDLVPARLMGRVRSLDFLVSFALQPLSYAVTGPLAGAIGAVPTIALGGALASAATFAFMLYPGVFDPDHDGYVPAEGSKAAERVSA